MRDGPKRAARWSTCTAAAVRALSLPQVRRRPPGLRARGRHRQLRRRPGQLQLSRASRWMPPSSAPTRTTRPARTPFHLRWNARARRRTRPSSWSATPGATQRCRRWTSSAPRRRWSCRWTSSRARKLRGGSSTSSSGARRRLYRGRRAVRVRTCYKRARGQMRALTDAGFMAGKQPVEAELAPRGRARAPRRTRRPLGDIAPSGRLRQLYPPTTSWSFGAAGSPTFTAGPRQSRRRERAKPNGERLPSSPARCSTAAPVWSPPGHPRWRAELSWWLSKTREFLTVDDPQGPAAARPRVAGSPGRTRDRRDQARRPRGAQAPLGRRPGRPSGPATTR
jgi:hypothetical protein